MSDTKENDPFAVTLFSEIMMVDQKIRAKLTKALPRGMELSHFSLLNFLAHAKAERTPVQLAKTFQVTKAAMTNTTKRLEAAGYIHIRPDWEDGRRKFIAISEAGIDARDLAVLSIEPVFQDVVDIIGQDRLRQVLPIMRELRIALRD